MEKERDWRVKCGPMGGGVTVWLRARIKRERERGRDGCYDLLLEHFTNRLISQPRLFFFFLHKTHTRSMYMQNIHTDWINTREIRGLRCTQFVDRRAHEESKDQFHMQQSIRDMKMQSNRLKQRRSSRRTLTCGARGKGKSCKSLQGRT